MLEYLKLYSSYLQIKIHINNNKERNPKFYFIFTKLKIIANLIYLYSYFLKLIKFFLI
jgi:hypothetical protein